MTDFQARIRRVRMKNGGADVHVIQRKGVNPGGEDWRGTILDTARKITDMATDEAPLVGYVVVGFFADGATSTGYRYDPEKCPVPRVLIPTWTAEVLRRDIVMDTEARSVFDDMFQWQDK